MHRPRERIIPGRQSSFKNHGMTQSPAAAGDPVRDDHLLASSHSSALAADKRLMVSSA